MAPVTTPTPHMRIVALLSKAAPLIGTDHPAYALMQEALRTAVGLDPYLEASSSPLIIPKGYHLPEEEVRAVWSELLEVTDKKDWHEIFIKGETKFELTNGMCSGDGEARILQTIAVTAGSTSVLEIGCFTGTAALAFALLPKIKKVVTLELEPYLKPFNIPYWERAGVSSKINMMIGPAVNSLHTLAKEGEQFSLVFIDANKTGYLEYVQLVLELNLLEEGGIILADNTLYKGYTYSPVDMGDNALTPTALLKSNNGTHDEATNGIIAFNNAVRDDPRLHVVMLPVRDGVSFIMRKI